MAPVTPCPRRPRASRNDRCGPAAAWAGGTPLNRGAGASSPAPTSVERPRRRARARWRIERPGQLVRERRGDQAWWSTADQGPPGGSGGELRCPGRSRALRTSHDVDAVLLAGPVGTHVEAARRHLAAGRPVVSTSDSIEDVRGLLDLDAEARARRVPVVVGAAFSPGYTCVLARHGAASFDTVAEVHVARSGTGGPACARQHHAALTGAGSRLARRRVAPPHRRVGPRAVLVPRPDRGGGLLPGRAARTPCCWCRPSPASSG